MSAPVVGVNHPPQPRPLAPVAANAAANSGKNYEQATGLNSDHGVDGGVGLPPAPPQCEEVILATAGYDHTVKFWQAHTGQCVRTIQHADSQVGETDREVSSC